MSVINLYHGPLKSISLQAFKTELTPDGVFVITFSRPEKLNSLDGQAFAEMFFLIEYMDREPSVKVAVWVSTGRAFCAGAALTNLHLPNSSPILSSFKAYCDAGKALRRTPDMAYHGLIYRMLELRKVSICCVQGMSIGGGANFSLLMHDFVFASESGASFRYPFSEIGICPEMGSSYLFPKQYAARYLMAGETFTARDAERMGLVYRVVPDGEDVASAGIRHAGALVKKGCLTGMEVGKKILNEQKMKEMDHYRICQTENETIDTCLKSPYTIQKLTQFSQRHSKM